MKPGRVLFSLVLVSALTAGCATTNGGPTIGGHTFSNVPCALIGAAVGAAAGGAAAGGGGAGIGLLGGAVMSQLFCGTSEPVDTDGDMVPDDLDHCPLTPAGAPVDEHGCPLDSDGDGVPDYRDECPTVPGATDNGCPPPPAPEPMMEAPFIESVHFDFDSARIKPISKAVLDARAIPVLRKNPDAKLRIEGHTDSIGTERYNDGLSLRRATAVRDYLVSQRIDARRLSVIGRGELQPIDTNKTRAGRANNRRVEFVFRQ